MSDTDWIDALVTKLPHVRPRFVDDVKHMDREELQRRVLIGSDWQGAFMCALDGIPEISAMPGSGIDGCRTHKEVRAIVTQLVAAGGKTWAPSYPGQDKEGVAPPADVEWLTAALAEADRRAGAAERALAWEQEASQRRDSWLRRAKRDWGVDDNVSFDVVWAEALRLKAKQPAETE